jgi:hypothetical protein
MTEQSNTDNIPNGAGQGQTDTDAPDTSSGGAPDPDLTQGTPTEESDGTPVENPSGG